MDKRLLTATEAARVVGIGRTKLYELMASGQLCSVKIGRRRLVPAAMLDEYIEQLIQDQDAA